VGVGDGLPRRRACRDGPLKAAELATNQSDLAFFGYKIGHIGLLWLYLDTDMAMLPSNPPEFSPRMLRLLARIEEFRGAWRATAAIPPHRLTSLRHIATIESVGSSTRIEGSALTDTEVEALLRGIGARRPTTRDEQEVAGYAQVVDLVINAHASIPLGENHIRQLHRDLLRHSEKDEHHRGNYKSASNSVVALDTHGRQVGVIFETATPFETPRLMNELIDWTNAALDDPDTHPLVTIGVFTVVFLAIHPFQDGNGRLSRILTTLLLLRTGYSFVPYSSLEAVIERTKSEYYLALRRTQSTLRTPTQDWQPWLEYFLGAMAEQVAQLERRLAREDLLLGTLPSLSEAILQHARERARITIGDMIRLTGAKRPTLKLHLGKLVERGALLRHGTGKGTYYTPTAPPVGRD
jgi:Fic family protein